ncbi:PREDICTED: uncharacterized protein LOC108370844 isoform X2 [Rhagoletis zephyria]|nr:PREDICTED: uncharacterized protein LOC108370844 isoform X2 [Rhagoletis zephyria]
MVAEMELMDYYYNMRDIKTKMQNMVARYRKERKLVKSGMPSVWDYYEEMHAIMTRYESNNSEILANCRSFSADTKDSAENSEKKWKIKDAMSRKSATSSQSGSDSQSNNTDIETQSEGDHKDDNQTIDNDQTVNLDENISFFSVPEKSKNDKNPLLVRSSLKKYKRSIPSVEWDKSDDIDLFFFSMSKTVKKLPYCEQVQLKKEISCLVFQAELKSIPA